MSIKIVTVEVLQCDHVDEKGVQCTSDGSRQAIKECSVCKKDLCSKRRFWGQFLTLYRFWKKGTHAFSFSLFYFGCIIPIPANVCSYVMLSPSATLRACPECNKGINSAKHLKS